MAELTRRQRRFVEEYLVDLNGAQAAIRAGYAERSARVTAARTLANDSIAAAVRDGMERRSRRTAISADRVLLEFARLAFVDMASFMSFDGSDARLDFSGLGEDQAAAIAEIIQETYIEGRGEDAEPVKRTRLKLHNKLAALDALAKHLGLFNASLPPEADPETNLRQMLRREAEAFGRLSKPLPAADEPEESQ